MSVWSEGKQLQINKADRLIRKEERRVRVKGGVITRKGRKAIDYKGMKKEEGKEGL